jgi:hypothetical protein
MQKSGSVVRSREAAISTGPVQLRVVQSDKQHTVLELKVLYEEAAPPERVYHADYCKVLKGRIGMTLVFGKLAPGTNHLRTQIEIAFPDEWFVRQLWAASRSFNETVRKLTEGRALAGLTDLLDADKVQSFSANNVFMAVFGEDSMMDFYYISPGEIHFFSKGKRDNVALQPVVRISLSSLLMREFLEACKVYAEELIGTGLYSTDKDIPSQEQGG